MVPQTITVRVTPTMMTTKTPRPTTSQPRNSSAKPALADHPQAATNAQTKNQQPYLTMRFPHMDAAQLLCLPGLKDVEPPERVGAPILLLVAIMIHHGLMYTTCRRTPRLSHRRLNSTHILKMISKRNVNREDQHGLQASRNKRKHKLFQVRSLTWRQNRRCPRKREADQRRTQKLCHRVPSAKKPAQPTPVEDVRRVKRGAGRKRTFSWKRYLLAV